MTCLIFFLLAHQVCEQISYIKNIGHFLYGYKANNKINKDHFNIFVKHQITVPLALSAHGNIS